MIDINRRTFKGIFYLTLLVRREWFLPLLQELKKTQYLSHEELERVQLDKLNALFSHAKKNIPFYQGRLPALPLESLDQLQDIALLEKGDLRTHGKELMDSAKTGQRLKTSGGSTGAPVTLLKNCEGMAHEMAATWRGYSWAGVNIGDKQARFWGVPRNRKDFLRAKLIDFVCNRKRITAFGYNPASMREAVRRLERFSPDYFYGYPSIIREFADLIESSGTETSLKPKCVITTAEQLSAEDKAVIGRVFKTRVFDEYGCGEVGTIAHECEAGALHLTAENMIVEVLADSGDKSQTGELVITDLTNYSMPLIRYRLKDYGTISKEGCPCGKGLPVLAGIHGRAYDILRNTAGEKFHGEFFLYIVEDARKLGRGVDGIQFVQNPDYSILVNIASSPSTFDNVSKYIKRRLEKDFDSLVKIDFQKVIEIPREPSGKLRVVKRNY